jgi:putative Ig domain-containing protein/parallel beta helix pectate lyase-like protein
MKTCKASVAILAACLFFFASINLKATTYEVGPSKALTSIGQVPWESLQAGDMVLIYWRSTPYKEKWVICRQGTQAAPITVRGVPGPAGELPVVDGNGATTRSSLNYWNETRAVIKIGGANVPADTLPKFITLENLDIRSARPPYTFVAANGSTQSYVNNASSIYVEKGENIAVRNCIIHDSGNGFFVASSDALASRNILVEGNYIYDNGNTGSIYEHNNYTAAIGITFQYNRFGPLRVGCSGNNLKDRSAGLVVRYNWIEGGNRQLDLVDGEDSSLIRSDPGYRSTYVYGNVLIEPDAAGNRQIAHYGGDSGLTASYRQGTLYFYNNSIISKRTDRTTLIRLSTNQEQCDFRNNIAYTTAAGSTMSLLDDAGVMNFSHNWLKPGWVNSFASPFSGTVNNDGTSVLGASPGFADELGQNYNLALGSPCINTGTFLDPAVFPSHDVLRQYLKHQASEARPNDGSYDIGAYEFASGVPPKLLITTTTLPNGTVGTLYNNSLQATGGRTPYHWSITSGSLPLGLGITDSGVISGTPTTQGTSTFIAQVVDAQSPSDNDIQQLSITVQNPSIPPINIITTSLPSAKRNRSYSQTIQVSGGVAPYLWSIVAGSLPPGLSLNSSTGAITGKATTVGLFSFTVRAADNQGTPASDTQDLAIRVNR